jgi:hypothetical protein
MRRTVRPRRRHPLVLAALAASAPLLLSSCSSVGYYLGFGTGEEDNKDKAEVIDRPDPNEYVLVKNPRYSPGGAPGLHGGQQEEYIWVKRKDAPFTVDAFVRGKKSLEASQDDEARFASTKPAEAAKAPSPDERFFVPPDQLKPPPKAQPEAARQRPAARPADPSAALRPLYGYVVLVKDKRIYTDLSEDSGAAVGNTLVVYREGEELKHPVTGASLGRADEEVGRARIVEVDEKRSVAVITEVKEGGEIHTADKVKLLRAN